MGLNKKNISDILDQFPFPKDAYWVLMGAALVLRGIKDEANDIDLGCADALFERIRHAGYSVAVNRMGMEKICYSDSITIYKNWRCEKVEMIDGYPVCDLDTIIHNKRALSREKDLADLQLIALHQGDEHMG